MAERIDYNPAPTIRSFIKDYRPGELFYDWIVGPVGSGKTTGIFFKLVYMAGLQAKSPDGIRRSKAVVVRNTMPQLKDTTLASWNYWFKDGQAGIWKATTNSFLLKFGDVECEVLFRPLDTPDDVARVLSLEVTFAIIDEFVQIPKEIIDALSARLGRYPSARDGGATNWGMWGSSNPSTEDNWWFDFLHHHPGVERVHLNEDPDKRAMRMTLLDVKDANAKYYLQPSGLSPEAENLEYLPGGRGYYLNQIRGKSEAWIKQFVEAEWGFSVAGKAVVPSFRADYHISKYPLTVNPYLPVVAGTDPGLAGSAFIFGQLEPNGRLNVLGELVQEGYGAERVVKERLKPYIRRRFPNNKVILAVDPAANNRSNNDEKTIVSTFKKYFETDHETNNRLPLRLDSIEYYTSTLVEQGPALQIDPKECPVLVRALKGGWRYAMNTKLDIMKNAEPEKNAYSHPGDGFGYLCRYFRKGQERETRYSPSNPNRQVLPRTFGSNYHFR